jgi:hypothetical protein
VKPNKLIGKITIYGGPGGSVLATLIGTDSGTDFGFYFSGGTHLTLDGVPHLVAGAPRMSGDTGASYLFSLF